MPFPRVLRNCQDFRRGFLFKHLILSRRGVTLGCYCWFAPRPCLSLLYPRWTKARVVSKRPRKGALHVIIHTCWIL